MVVPIVESMVATVTTNECIGGSVSVDHQSETTDVRWVSATQFCRFIIPRKGGNVKTVNSKHLVVLHPR